MYRERERGGREISELVRVSVVSYNGIRRLHSFI
jgi:hypothetical protein